MNIDLKDRHVAVTGASAGIGEATAIACAAAGAKVAIAARRADRLEAVADRITAAGGDAFAYPADVGVEAEARGFIEGAHDRFGRLDVLVNNAGLMLLAPVAGADTEDWRRMIHINVFGVLYCTHAALGIMRDQGHGHIVNVSSTAGRTAGINHGVYSLTKWGMNGFSEALRQEAQNFGVRVTVIEPGVVQTELIEHNSPEIRALAAELLADVEQLKPKEIADAILFAVAQPPSVAVNELLIRPMNQSW